MSEQVIQVFGISSAKSDNCLVIGNGESRSQINLEQFKEHYTLIGCNALCRDIALDHLVVCDRRMIEEAVNHPNSSNSTIHVRDDWYHYYRKIKKNKNVKCLPEIPYVAISKPDEKRNWGSGTFAVLLSTTIQCSNIYLLGFDLYDINFKVNNVYKDTANYSPASSQPVDPAYWIYQISKIFSLYPDKKFTVINKVNWKMPETWKQKNVSFKTLNDFLVDNKYPSSIITT